MGALSMLASFDTDDLPHALLTYVTAGPGLGFNRAILFLPDERNSDLTATMAIGPASEEEAHAIWTRLANDQRTLSELFQGTGSREGGSRLSTLIEGLTIPLRPAAGGQEGAASLANPLVEAYESRQVRRISDPRALDRLPPPLRAVFGGTEVVCVPLVGREGAIGLIVADNAFNHQPISDERIALLELLALMAGLTLDNIRISRRLESQARDLQTALHLLKTTQDRLLHNERLATVGAVAAHVSHEIRNPLATIGGFARTLRTHPTDGGRVARGAAIIVEEVEKLEVLLKELLDFTSPKPPRLAPVDLNEKITTFAGVHREALAEHAVALSLDLAAESPMVLADASQLERVFLNLWCNAVQAMDTLPLDGARDLHITTSNQDDRVRITFTDTGPGIGANARAHIFTPFFTTKPRGTGLGLATVRKIIDDHGGSIDVWGPEHAGTTFAITLPASR